MINQIANRTVHRRLKAQLFKPAHCRTYHPLKAELISDVDRPLRGQINPVQLKSLPVSLRISARHILDLLYFQLLQMSGCSKLILSDIFSKIIQVLLICQICRHDQRLRKAVIRI